MLHLRGIAGLSAVAAGAALAVAFGAERWAGMVPCALCLLERWPYRLAVLLGLAAALAGENAARSLLTLALMAWLASLGLAATHVGVEQGYWPSPLPECAAPRLTGGTVAERLAQLPASPAKPCDEPSYLIPGLPLSIAATSLIYSSVVCVVLAATLGNRRAA